MKKAEMKPFKELLLDLRARLRGDVSSLANTALSHGDSADAGRAPADIADLGNSMLEENNSLLLTDRSEEPRLNSSHITISSAVFCLKKKKNHKTSSASDFTLKQIECSQQYDAVEYINM